jgi:hypothetical protein
LGAYVRRESFKVATTKAGCLGEQKKLGYSKTRRAKCEEKTEQKRAYGYLDDEKRRRKTNEQKTTRI